MRILITGAAGWTAEAIIRACHRAGHRVYGLDLEQAAGWNAARNRLAGAFTGDIADFHQVERIFRDSDPEAVIHLAVAVGKQNYEEAEVPFRTNVQGAYNVFEAARRQGARRMVLISSAPVHLVHDLPGQVDTSSWRSSAGGDHLYDLTKRLQEVIACDFSETFDLSTVILRAGHIVDGRAGVDPRGRALSGVMYCRGGWVCRYDLARACLGAISRERRGCETYDVIGSVGARAQFDIERTERELGLTLETGFEQYE